MSTKTKTLLTLGLFSAGSFLNAQGGFVLFGDPAPEIEAEERVVKPISAPYFHEDAFVTTDLRAWALEHHFYSDTIEGDLTVVALQARLAITDRIQLVAYKDGLGEFDDTLGDEDGVFDIGAGIKYAILQDWENQAHFAVGIGYEFAVGDEEMLQDTNELRLWASWNKGFGPLHFGLMGNLIFAEDEDDGLLGNSDLTTIHVHVDYYLCEWVSPVVEINGYFVSDEGPANTPFSGVDAVSLAGGANEDTVTGAFGAEFRPLGPELGLRFAYETELTDNISLFGHRWTVSAVYEF